MVPSSLPRKSAKEKPKDSVFSPESEEVDTPPAVNETTKENSGEPEKESAEGKSERPPESDEGKTKSERGSEKESKPEESEEPPEKPETPSEQNPSTEPTAHSEPENDTPERKSESITPSEPDDKPKPTESKPKTPDPKSPAGSDSPPPEPKPSEDSLSLDLVPYLIIAIFFLVSYNIISGPAILPSPPALSPEQPSPPTGPIIDNKNLPVPPEPPKAEQPQTPPEPPKSPPISDNRTRSPEGSDTIKIGVMIPLTGDTAVYGNAVRKGVELALTDNPLENVKLIYEDSKCTGKDAVSAVNKLISVDNVIAIIGELCSSATLAAAPIAQENGVVMISPATTAPSLSNAGSFIFRTIPSDALQGAYAASVLIDDKHQKLAILYGNEDYGLGFSDVLSNIFRIFGGKIVASEAFERTSVDLKSQLTKIKVTNPDAIYIISNSPDSSVAALKQIVELGINSSVYASEGLKSPTIIAGAGTSAEGLIVTSVTAGTPDFLTQYEKVYGEEPDSFAAQAYDALSVIVLGLQSGATTSEELRTFLNDVDFSGATGEIVFDNNGDVTGSYEVFVVENGTFVRQ